MIIYALKILGTASYTSLIALLLFLMTWSQWRRLRRSRRYNFPTGAMPAVASHGVTAMTPLRVAFLHPNATGGGGGERVLWLAVKALRKRYTSNEVVIQVFCKNLPRHEIVIDVVKTQFGLDLRGVDFEIRALWSSPLLDATRYPVLTLLLQFLAGGLAGLEMVFMHGLQDVFIDTTGHSASLAVARWLGGCHVATYVHYPTISMDMIQVVRNRTAQFNNSERIANSSLRSMLKLVYYRIFAYFYHIAGSSCDVIMVNSTWTRSHIANLWPSKRRAITTVYPPVDIQALAKIALNSSERDPSLIMSLAQFRPEKNHILQLEAFGILVQKLSRGSQPIRPKLVLIGGARSLEDQDRVNTLMELAVSKFRFKVPDQVEFVVNAPRAKVTSCLERAAIGLHTMKDEHFGISIVELQAAGVIPIGHHSGGVSLDIIQNGTNGFLANNAEEYATTMEQILNMSTDQKLRIQESGRHSAGRFSDQVFEDDFLYSMAPVLPS